MDKVVPFFTKPYNLLSIDFIGVFIQSCISCTFFNDLILCMRTLTTIAIHRILKIYKLQKHGTTPTTLQPEL